MSQVLPAKEQATFRSVIRFYETKQYKKGIKAADQILKKIPDHGETLCMKGLTLSFLTSGKKEEAYDLVRKGLRNDMKSHVCWHVFGLLHRQERDYKEAVKCYRQALRIDPENVQILRDLSLLQIHTRDLPGFVETRQRLLSTKPQNRIHWMGYAVANHLTGNLEFAALVLDQYWQSFNADGKGFAPYEQSEILLYKAQLFEELGKLEEAEKVLANDVKCIVDQVGLLETQARLAFRLGKLPDAGAALRKLLAKIPENQGYALALLACDETAKNFWPSPAANADNVQSFPPCFSQKGGVYGWLSGGRNERPPWVQVGARMLKRRQRPHMPTRKLTTAEQEHVVAFFDALLEQHPKSESLQYLPVHFLDGDLLRERLDKFLRPRLRRAIPALFSVVKSLYYVPGRIEVIDGLLRAYLASLKEAVSTLDHLEEEPPATLTFTQLFFAQHLDMQGKWEEALQVLDEAIQDTPTLAELYSCKAKVLKHMGDLEEAGSVLEQQRQMDLADRYLNTLCVRGLLRLDEAQAAQETVLLFDFHAKEAANPQEGNLFDMQVMWFEYYLGLSLKRNKEYGRALKKFHDTFKHFQDIQEDQFDFHSYCFRKTTLRTYARFLHVQDELYSHIFYRRAAKAALGIYQELENVAPKKDETEEPAEKMSAAEKKRLKHKQKREQKGKEEPVAEKGKEGKKKDEDPQGEKLVVPEKAAEDALGVVRTLCKHCALDPVTYRFAYLVQQRRGKLLLCLQALTRLWALEQRDPLAPKLCPLLAHFCFLAPLEATPERVRTVIFAQVGAILGSAVATVAELRVAAGQWVDRIELRLQREDLRLNQQAQYFEGLTHAGRASSIAGHVARISPRIGHPLKECVKMLAFLCSHDAALADRFREACRKVYPRARALR